MNTQSMTPAQPAKRYEIQSPDGRLTVQVEVGEKLRWSVRHAGEDVLLPSSLSLALEGGEVLGERAKVKTCETASVDAEFQALFYRKAAVKERYTQMLIGFEGDFSVAFRAYDDAAAYRFITRRAGQVVVVNEEASFNFSADHLAFIPYLRDYREGEIFNASFESQYAEERISQFHAGELAFLPLLVDLGGEKKAVILEADLEDYPGMYLDLNATGMGFKGVFAPYPLETRRGGYNGMNVIPTRRAEYIALTEGARSFPWRAVAIAEADKDLLNNDIVQKLASPPRLADVSWIEPGQVAWDWWCDYNLTRVDFKAGINTATYKYFADFAAANGAKYIILDWNWSETFDLNKVNPDLDLEEIIAHAKSKNVGVILWASWYTITQQMKEVFPKYAAMGIKGWKIDFIDRDDQVAVASTYEIAALAAKYHFLVDYHGVFKPTGLQRTYPNVVGYEGVYGLENYKWADNDMPRYDVTVPYTRNMAGPMDYTPGAMINVTQADFKARNHAPMSKGTRCHQVAMYVVYEAPLQMLSDSPTHYMKEQECTDFITSIPTFTDETAALDGRVGEYAVVARRKGEVWYVGAMSNWEPRDLTIDTSFLGSGLHRAVILQDGVNADREPTDYKKVVIEISAGESLPIHLAGGGGWAARIEKA